MMRRDEYLKVVARSLGKLPKEVAESRLAELRSHLALSTQEFVTQGLVPDEAEARAIAEMGPPRPLAGMIVRQHLGYAGKSVWRLSAWLMPVLMLAILIPYGYENAMAIRSEAFPAGSVDTVFSIGGWIAVIAYSWLVWRTRRWFVVPATVASLVALVVFAIGATLSAPAPRSVPAMQATAAEIRQLSEDLNAVRQWRAGHPPTNEGPVRDTIWAQTTVPLLPFSIPMSRLSTPRLRRMNTAEARAAWASLGESFAKTIEPNKAPEKPSPPRSGWQTLLLVLPVALFWFALYCIVLFTTWNAAVLLVARFIERRAQLRFVR